MTCMQTLVISCLQHDWIWRCNSFYNVSILCITPSYLAVDYFTVYHELEAGVSDVFPLVS